QAENQRGQEGFGGVLQGVQHESGFRGLIAVNAFTEDVVDAGAGAGQSLELDLQENTGAVVEVVGREDEGVVPVDPAPRHQGGTPAAAGVFESGEDLQFLVAVEILVVAAEQVPAGGEGHREGGVELVDVGADAVDQGGARSELIEQVVAAGIAVHQVEQGALAVVVAQRRAALVDGAVLVVEQQVGLRPPVGPESGGELRGDVGGVAGQAVGEQGVEGDPALVLVVDLADAKAQVLDAAGGADQPRGHAEGHLLGVADAVAAGEAVV